MKKAFPCIQTGNLQTPLDECGEAAEEWLTQFTWACTTRRALNNLASHSNYKENVYYIGHDLFYPEQWPVPGWHRQCYSKSCHCIGKKYYRMTQGSGSYINVGDGCWRRSMLVTSLRDW